VHEVARHRKRLVKAIPSETTRFHGSSFTQPRAVVKRQREQRHADHRPSERRDQAVRHGAPLVTRLKSGKRKPPITSMRCQ
jgi:hypothetical protein